MVAIASVARPERVKQNERNKPQRRTSLGDRAEIPTNHDTHLAEAPSFQEREGRNDGDTNERRKGSCHLLVRDGAQE